jgi:uncharacterized protein (DUF1501 family)
MANNRRQFIKDTTLAAAGTLLVPSFLSSLSSCRNTNDFKQSGKKLVVIQLAGGVDGLSLAVPYRNDLYYQLRPRTAYKEKDLLLYNEEIGFHSALSCFQSLIESGHLSILNNVGYPNPDHSHFRSTDIWHTASDSNQYLTSGWMGRYLDANCHQNCKNIDVVEIGEMVSQIIKGQLRQGFSLLSPKELYHSFPKILKSNKFLNCLPKFQEDGNQSFLYKTMMESKNSAEYLYSLTKYKKNRHNYPNAKFGKDLKTVADLIVGGAETSIYYLNHGGFDTHAQQMGALYWPLHEFNLGIESFTKDLKGNGQLDNTLILCFYEFGRRVTENESGGTDHGAANSVYLIGGGLKRQGILNELPDLNNLQHGDLKHTIDFRQVYATILKNWLNVNPIPIIKNEFQLLDFV